MTVPYFDTSALIKLVVEEEGTESAIELWQASLHAVTSRLAYPEARAALAAARHAGLLTHGYRRAVSDFAELFRELEKVEIDAELAYLAGELAEEHGLRGYDAVHLASALELGPATILVTWDAALARAGDATGLAVAPPPST